MYIYNVHVYIDGDGEGCCIATHSSIKNDDLKLNF